MKSAQLPSPYPLRIPDELRKYLKHAAIDNRRTLHGELLARLEASRRSDQGAAAPAAQQQ